jgi:phosphinothricin acetyltransferase
MGAGELNIVVRRLRHADLSQVSDIFGWYAINSAATFEESPRADADWSALAAELDGLGLPFLVAEADGAVAGYAYAGPWRRKAAYRATVEDSVFIAPGLTGRGIGLHESCGFTHAGRLADVGYKHGNWIGTLLMQRAVG